jgi:hypothetical protein
MNDIPSVLVEISARDTDFSPENSAFSVLLPAHVHGKQLLGKFRYELVMYLIMVSPTPGL